MATFNYAFSAEILQDGTFNEQRLISEIQAVLHNLTVARVIRVRAVSGDLQIQTVVSRELTPTEKADLDVLLRAHQSDSRYLPAVKAAKFAAIDRRTREIIARGFIFRGIVHSLSQEAQKNLTDLDRLRADPALTWPIKFNSKDDMTDNVIANANEMHQMALAGLTALKQAWDSGTAIKVRVRTAATVEQVRAVVDDR